MCNSRTFQWSNTSHPPATTTGDCALFGRRGDLENGNQHLSRHCIGWGVSFLFIFGMASDLTSSVGASSDVRGPATVIIVGSWFTLETPWGAISHWLVGWLLYLGLLLFEVALDGGPPADIRKEGTSWYLWAVLTPILFSLTQTRNQLYVFKTNVGMLLIHHLLSLMS